MNLDGHVPCTDKPPIQHPLLPNGDASTTDSSNGSQQQPSSNNHTPTSISFEERMKRVRAAEQLKQQQRYAAYIEAQQQAEQALKRQQEERKRRIEEIRRKEEYRRNSVLERRNALEQFNQARIQKIRERSMVRSLYCPPRTTVNGSNHYARTASASPSFNATGNQNNLMTTSCMVAFGSSAPRNICTQQNQAALRMKKAFEDRLASYLTGRHSGCFFTPTASPLYACLIDKTQLPNVQKQLTSEHNSRAHSKSRRASSAHSSFMRKFKPTPSFSCIKGKQAQSITSHKTSSDERIDSKIVNTVWSNIAPCAAIQTKEVNSSRSNSSQECDKVGNQKPAKAKLNSARTNERDTKSTNKSGESLRSVPPTLSNRRSTERGLSASAGRDLTTESADIKKKPTKPPSGKTINSEVKKEVLKTSVDTSDQSNVVNEELNPDASSNSSVNNKDHDEIQTTDSCSLMDETITNDQVASVIDNTIVDDGLCAKQIKAETQSSGGAMLSQDEAALYRAKLVEQRRLAKERKEEEQRKLEEELLRRKMEEEQIRLAAERALEQERELAAREAEEAQRQKEEEDLAKLKLAEIERIAKLQRAEEERVLRKKKLDSIMSRVKAPPQSNEPQSHSPTDSLNDQVVSTNAATNNNIDNSDTENSNEDVTTTTTTNNNDLVMKDQLNSTHVSSSDRNSLVHINNTVENIEDVQSQSQGNVPSTATVLNRTENDLFDSPANHQSKQHGVPVVTNFGDSTRSIALEIDSLHGKTTHANQNADESGVDIEQKSDAKNNNDSSIVETLANNHSDNKSLDNNDNNNNDNNNNDNTNNNNNSNNDNGPHFKSALLRSMLGKGRLSTRAKDAVAEFRFLSLPDDIEPC